jgi:hypothetical protein
MTAAALERQALSLHPVQRRLLVTLVDAPERFVTTGYLVIELADERYPEIRRGLLRLFGRGLVALDETDPARPRYAATQLGAAAVGVRNTTPPADADDGVRDRTAALGEGSAA